MTRVLKFKAEYSYKGILLNNYMILKGVGPHSFYNDISDKNLYKIHHLWNLQTQTIY